jgi:hypothetical protein
LRLIATAGAVWLLFGGVYWVAAEQRAFAPNAALVLAEPRLAPCRPDCAQLPSTMPGFQPLVYSLEVLMPLIDLQQTRHWAPARDAWAVEVEGLTGVPLLRMLTWLEAWSGWMLGLTLLASTTGLTDRDRKR